MIVSDYKLELREVVRELRLAKGWTMKELSKHAGVARVTIWTIENGTKGVSLAMAKKLAKAFGIHLMTLLLLSKDIVEKELQIALLQAEMHRVALSALTRRGRRKK